MRSKSVHPRVGGEHRYVFTMQEDCYGSSPRGRGTPGGIPARDLIVPFIPAWAGNTVLARACRLRAAVHPRVGGEHNKCSFFRVSPVGSSPRGRGTRLEILRF